MTELEKLASLSGLITDEQGLILAELAKSVSPDHAIVEIGSYKGKSTCYLAYGAGPFPHGPLVWAVDPWTDINNVNGKHHYAELDTKKAFERNIEFMGYGSRIFIMQLFSVEAAHTWKEMLPSQDIGLLYIDGDHSEDAVRTDFLSWLPLLTKDAIVAFDDLDTKRNPGVRIVVDEILSLNKYKDFRQFNNLGVLYI